jgi:hypothetical protein
MAILEDTYNQLLVDQLADQFGVSPARANELINCIAENILFYTVFKGPINTPFGKIAMLQGGLQIIEQNKALINSFKKEQGAEAITAFIKDIISGE